ncbi:MAG: hypothetical protein HXL95_03715 [[Eubacterium] sulci]|jgi:hypothetical protein|nr:hypothetical protein [[Eubacterium] sulci]
MGERFFSIIFGAIFICIGIGYILYPRIILNDSRQIVGDIVNVNTAVPETMKKNNSKWAVVRIKIDNKEYYSNLIQVPMEMNIGDRIEVKYDKNNPSNMCLSKRNGTGLMFFVIGILIVLYGIFKNK